MRFFGKNIVRIILVVVFAGLITAGLFRNEIIDVIGNARITCYSCIGIK